MQSNEPENRPEIDTAAGYDLWAPSYDQLDNPLVAMTHVAMAQWAPRLEGKRVLEIGCGTGRNARVFLEAGVAEYVGVDGSSGMLAVARARFNQRARWVEADAREALPADLRDFDGIFFSLVLEHVPSLEVMVKNAAAVVRASGFFRSYELHAELRNAGARAHFRDGERELLLPSFAHDAEEYRTALNEAGFELTRTTDWHATEAACRASAKLARYLGRPVLLEVDARRR